MNTHDDMADLLYAASDGAPPNRVDLAAVVRDGRRRRRRRRIVVPLVAAAAVGAVVAGVLVTGALRPQGLEPVPPATQTPSVTPTLPVPRTAFPFDRRLFTIDGAGELTSMLLTARTQTLTYGHIDLEVFAAGSGEPVLEPGFQAVEAPAVNGLRARYRTALPHNELVAIEFEWAPDAWATLRAGEPTQDRLHDLATRVRPVDEPVRFWFSLGAPPGLTLAAAVPFEQGEEANWAAFEFTLDGTRVSGGDGSWVNVEVGEYFDVGPEQATPNATIAGRPALVEEWADGFSVQLLDTAPYRVLVAVHGNVLSQADAEALVASVVLHGTWEDRTQWTDNPLG